MSNQIIDACESLGAEGYSISAVTISRAGRGRLLVSISRNNFFPLGEGDSGESGVHVDTRDMPDGVTVRGFDRCEDYRLHLDGSDEQAEALIRDVAAVGLAQDWARFDGDTPDYPHWLTKPNKWHRMSRADMSGTPCPVCGTPMICARCIGAQGGASTSKAKARAARENGKLGGRPRKRRKPKRHNPGADRTAHGTGEKA